jgi:type II secretory pathway component PulM
VRELWRRLLVAWEGLSRNERLLVGIAGGLLALTLFWFALVMPLIGAAGRAASNAAAAEQQVQAVRALRERFDEVNGRLVAVEQRIRSGPTGEIFTTLEQMAAQSAVKIDSMEPRTSPASEEYRETKVQVSLKGVSLAQLVGFLSRIDDAPQLLSVKSLRIRTRADKQDLLDVTFTVSSFEVI